MISRFLRTGASAGLWLAALALAGTAGAAGEPAAPPTPPPALQRDIEAVNRLLRQRQLQAAPPPSAAPAPVPAAPARPPVQAPPAVPAPPATARPAPDDDQIRRTIELLVDDSPAARSQAQHEIRAAGAAAVPALIDALEDPEQRIRIAAVVALGEIRDPRAAEPLVELLGEPSKAMWNALWGAFWSLRKSAAPALIPALGSNDQRVRGRAVTLMGAIRDSRFTEPLIELLNKDRSTGVRVDIAAALGKIGDRQACEALLDALHDW